MLLFSGVGIACVNEAGDVCDDRDVLLCCSAEVDGLQLRQDELGEAQDNHAAVVGREGHDILLQLREIIVDEALEAEACFLRDEVFCAEGSAAEFFERCGGCGACR